MRMSAAEFADHQQRIAASKAASKSVAPKNAKQHMQAKGRLAPGVMNKTEERYAQVLEARKQAGEIVWWAFEAVKLKLAPNTHLTIDFTVMLADGVIQMHDVKGAKAIIQDDSKVKMKVARDKFPFAMFYAFPPKKGEQAWTLEEV